MRALTFVLVMLLGLGCGGSSPSAPTTPSTPNAPSAVTFSVTGVITNAARGTQSGIAARVEILAGPNTGRSTTTDASGRYEFTGLAAGQVSLRASADGFTPQTLTVGLLSNLIAVGFALMPTVLTTAGRVVDVLSGQGIPGVGLTGAGFVTTTTDGTGAYALASSTGLLDLANLLLSGPLHLARQTSLRPGGPDALLSMIPASFDLVAFDAMFRTPELRRWVAAPPLRIQTTSVVWPEEDEWNTVTDAYEMTDAEVTRLLDDLRWALPQMTGDTFRDFARVDRVSLPPNTPVSLYVDGMINVVRVSGMQTATGSVGYGSWTYNGAGEITSGVVLLDRDTDRSGRFGRQVRSHELGHALGYRHVTTRSSVMFPFTGYEPLEFDRQAARIAFARPTGNRSPDIDPPLHSANRLRSVQTREPWIR